MGHAAAHKATFTGTLLRREHTIGQRVVQLVFRDSDKDWLCLSSNLTNIKLEVGQKYRIRGILRSLGGRTYVHEPRISLAGSRVAVFRRFGFGLGIVLLVATLTAMAVRLVHGSLAVTSADTLSSQYDAETPAAGAQAANTAVSVEDGTASSAAPSADPEAQEPTASSVPQR